MLTLRTVILRAAFAAAPVVCLSLATPAYAYVDLAPTLAKIITDSKQISLAEVAEYDHAAHAVVLKPVRMLKGDAVTETVRHQVTAADGAPVPRQIAQWAEPGARAVVFASRATSLVCIGESWYQVRTAGTAGWRLGTDRPDLPLAYCGTVSRLADAVEGINAGKDAVITNVPHGAEGEAASFDLAFNRFNIPGLVRLQRLRTNLKMSGPVMATSASPIYVLGQGPVDEADLPALIQKLGTADAGTKAEAAQDIRSLGRKAASAADALAKLLADPSTHARLSAASALLRVAPKDARPLDVLSQGLTATDPATRRDAAKATGLAGPAAAPLAEKLAALLKDADEPTRIAALQAVTVLGPAAAKAAPAVAPLLDNPELMIDAADALGRIGPAARPLPPQLAKMLASDQTAVQWAAVRAMSQIGGPEAHPAVEYMMKALPNSTEIDGYNIMIYLSLLGPDAKDAAPVVRSVRIKNPILPSSTLWAMEPEKSLPWQNGRGGFGGGGRGGPGGPGGGGPGGPGGPATGPAGQGGPGGGPGGFGPGGPGGPGGGGRGGPGGGGGMGLDIGRVIYEAYIDELGTRLRPAAGPAAKKIMDGTAGDVPEWGYRLLNAGLDDSLAVLTPYLAGDDAKLRERAAVALGFMGPPAAAAKEKLVAAAAKAPNEREKRLLQWAVRKIEEE